MWRRSFVATTVALGGTVDDALSALPGISDSDSDSDSGAAANAQLDDIVIVRGSAPDTPGESLRRSASLHDIVTGLRASARPVRAAALAAAVRDIVVAIDRTTLR